MSDSTHPTRHHYKPLKDHDADNLNRLEEIMQFSAGRGLTPEEGRAVTHLSPEDQKEFDRVATSIDRFRRKGLAP